MTKRALDRRTQTLSQFSQAIDEHAGRAVGFDGHVRRLFTVRTQMKQIEAARAGVFAHVRKAHQVGHRELRGSDGCVYQILETQPRPPLVYRAAPSEVVKKANPAAWKAAVVSKNFVQIDASIMEKQRVPVIAVPDSSVFISPPDAVILHRSHPAWEALKQLRTMKMNIEVALGRLATEFGWDGGVKYGPLAFTDGWSVQLLRGEYSSDALAEMAPDVFDQLAVTKWRQIKPRVYVRKVDQDDEDWEGDADEIDGD